MNNSSFMSQSVGKHTQLLVSFVILIIALVFESFANYTNYVIYPIWLLWFYVLFTSTNSLSKNEHVFIRVSFAFLSLVLVYWLIGYSSITRPYIMRTINWIMMGVTAVCAMSIFSKRELSTIYFFLTMTTIILMFILIRNGRMIIAMGEQSGASEVANAWYGSLFMLLSGLSLVFILHVKSIIPRIVAIIVLLVTLYINFFILQRGTNVIFTLAEIGIILVFMLKRKGLVYFFSIVIFVLAIYIYAAGLLIDIFVWLADIIPSERIAKRFNEIATALYYEDLEASSGSLAGRSNLMGISWHTFTSSIGHFVFGVGEHSGDNTIVGHHSFFIDMLAKYGIIGGAMMFVYFKKQYQIIMSYMDNKADWALYMQCSIVFLFYVLRNFYGQVTYALVNMIILVYFPLTFQIIQHYKTKSQI